jgi:hypothetical protein
MIQLFSCLAQAFSRALLNGILHTKSPPILTGKIRLSACPAQVFSHASLNGFSQARRAEWL